MPLLILAAIAAYLLITQRPDIVSQIAGGYNWDRDNVTSGNTPFAQSLISPTISPMGSKLNPRLMRHTTYAITMPDGATQDDANAIVLQRGSNIPIKMFKFENGVVYLTVSTNDEPEFQGFDNYLRSIPDVTVTETNRRTVRVYLIANSWVEEDNVDAFIADCPRQKQLNPGVGFGECPTSW